MSSADVVQTEIQTSTCSRAESFISEENKCRLFDSSAAMCTERLHAVVVPESRNSFEFKLTDAEGVRQCSRPVQAVVPFRRDNGAQSSASKNGAAASNVRQDVTIPKPVAVVQSDQRILPKNQSTLHQSVAAVAPLQATCHLQSVNNSSRPQAEKVNVVVHPKITVLPSVTAITAASNERTLHGGRYVETNVSTTCSTEADVDSSTDVEPPDGYCRVISCLPASTERDQKRLLVNCNQLNQCTFYAAAMTSIEAKERLRHSLVGMFIVRDSCHPRYLYSLSIKTRRGVTSIRLAYDSRGFSLDGDPSQTSVIGQSLMPAFETVLDLVAHYVAESRREESQIGSKKSGAMSSCVFLEKSGRRDLPVFLRHPCHMTTGSLKHLSRLSVNSLLAGRNPHRLVLKPSLKEYLSSYKFDV